MNNTSPKQHFIKLIQLWGIILIVGVALSITGFDIFGSLHSFNSQSDKMRSEYIHSQKGVVKQEVLDVVSLITYKKAQRNTRTKKAIKLRTYEAIAIADNIYQQNKTLKTTIEIRAMIIDALRPIRFEKNKGYYFICDLNGTEILFPDNPDLEGKNLLEMQDSRGKNVVKDMIKIIKRSSEGFYQYHWTEPGSKGNDYQKISFIKKLEALNLFIGTGLYVDDVEESIKQELLETINRIRFGKEGYIFVNRFNGDALIGNGTLYSGSQKLWDLFNSNPEKTKELFAKEHAAALTPDGDFIYYTFRKLNSPEIDSPKSSFIYGIPDLQWLVGAGVYLDDIESDIAFLQADLSAQIKAKVLFSIFITSFILFVFLFLFHRISKKLNRDIALLVSFFNQPLSADSPIDKDLIQFYELDEMARNINTMFLDKILAQQLLQKEEMSLLQTEAKYRSTMDSTLIGVYIIQDSIFQYVNPTMAAMFGYTTEEMEGKMSPVDLVVPEQREQVQENIIRHASGELKHANDIRCVRQNGEIFDTMALGTATIHEGKAASVGTMIDITERKAAENKLKMSEQRATALLEAIPDMVFRMTDQGVYIDYKADPSELYVQAPEQIIGKTSQQILPPELAALVEKCLKDTIKTGKMNTFEYQLAMPGKGVLHYEARMVKSGDNEITSIVRDITELKKVRIEKDTLGKELNRAKRMESIGLMAGGVAHDLNNILAGIIGYPELILHTLPPEENILRPQIVAIQESGKRAAAVVDDLLTVARGAASTREVHELDALATEYLNSLEFKKIQSLHPQVVIHQQLGTDHAAISCSQVHIKKCLMNLVNNGIEAIFDSGTVTISTHIHIQTDHDISEIDLAPSEYAVLSILDDGPGIVDTDLEHIFEPFYSKKTMARSGTGLGLTVVWNTVQDHDGKIAVKSSENGTLFQLYFPICHQGQTALPPIGNTLAFSGNGEHVLIIDDEPTMRDIGRQMLESLNYTVDTVSNGKAAIDFVKETEPDILLIDMLMEPGINGYQTYKEIVKIHPNQKALIASGFSESDDVKATLKLGASGFIKKPYTLEQLGKAVKKVIPG